MVFTREGVIKDDNGIQENKWVRHFSDAKAIASLSGSKGFIDNLLSSAHGGLLLPFFNPWNIPDSNPGISNNYDNLWWTSPKTTK